MWTTTLPTGTVRDEGRGSRTFPKQSTSATSRSDQRPRSSTHSGQTHSQQRNQPHHDGRSTVAQQSELERLRKENREANAEIERLESQVDQLQTQLADHKQAEQAMVDRYERVISELESAAATTPASTPESAATNTNRKAEYGLLSRLKHWL